MTAAEPPDDAPRPAPRVVVLDVGEVLVDETRVWSVWAQMLGVSPLTFAAVLGAAVVQGEDHVATFTAVAPNVEWRELLEEHETRYGGFAEQDLYPDVRPCLARLQELGLRVLVAGNQPAHRTAQLRALELPVEAVVTSEELGAEKPSSAFYDAVLAWAGLEDASEALYVGDRVDNDVLPAAEHGFATCWLRRGPWGRLQDLPDDYEADLVLDGLGELPELLEAWATDQP